MIERSAERDAALQAMLPFVAEHGWTARSLRQGMAEAGLNPEASGWLFAGTADMVEAYIDLADRRMAAAASQETRVSRRVRELIATRLEQAQSEQAAVRRAAAVLALPMNAGVAARSLARTVDTIWHAAGDRSVDASWYSKRGILAGVYAATLLHWLSRDALSDAGCEATLAFLDRRLAGVARIGRLKARLASRGGSAVTA